MNSASEGNNLPFRTETKLMQCLVESHSTFDRINFSQQNTQNCSKKQFNIAPVDHSVHTQPSEQE